MKRCKLYGKLNNLLMIFLVLQPVLDVYMALVGNAFDIFGISIATLIRTIFVITIFTIVVISQIKYKYHTKYAYVILCYLGAVIVYSLLHHINIVTFNGYYITNGEAIKIKCIKEARNLQTRYEDLNGNEIEVNDGNTWIHICPINSKVGSKKKSK